MRTRGAEHLERSARRERARLARLRRGGEAAQSVHCGGQQLGRLGSDAREFGARGGGAREVRGAALGLEPAVQRRVRAA